jgi:hypothetical protein
MRTLTQPRQNSTEPRSGRIHGDSYSDVSSRDDELAGSSSTHAPERDRGPEEPADAPLDAPDRLEDTI